MTQNLKFPCASFENIVEKGENAGYLYFLFVPQCFQNPSSLRSEILGIVGEGNVCNKGWMYLVRKDFVMMFMVHWSL